MLLSLWCFSLTASAAHAVLTGQSPPPQHEPLELRADGVSDGAPPPPPVDWRQAKCEGIVVDAKARPDLRWAAAGASQALRDMVAAWGKYEPRPGEVAFEFSQFASYFFGGPEMWRCTQLLDVPCSTALRCQQTRHPAGYLILNSLSKMHQFQRRYYEGLDQAQVDIQSEMSLFAEKFSVPPPESDHSTEMQRVMLNVIYGIVGVGQSFANNVFVYSSLFQGFLGLTQTMRSQMTTTSSYSIFTGWAVAKDSMLPKAAGKAAYGSVSAMMGDIFDGWKAAQVAYNKHIFSPHDKATVDFLIASLDNGLMTATPDEYDFREISHAIKKLFYPHLMLATWQTVPGARRPFILRTGLECKMKKGERSNALYAMLPDEDHSRASACYNGALFYLLDIRSEGVTITFARPRITPSVNWPLTALYGTETMDGTNWGGVTKEDIVAAVYGGWVAGGRMNGNYEPNYTDVNPSGDSPLWFGLGNRMPGYVQMPLCQNMQTIYGNVQFAKPDSNKAWPCAALPVIKPNP